MKTPSISYREWLHRTPTPPASVPPVPEEAPPSRAALTPTGGEAPAPEAQPADAGRVLEPASAGIAETEPEPAEVSAPTRPLPAGAQAPIPVVAAAPAVEAVEHLVFRVGRELFAVPLDAVEEALDIDRVQRIPEMSSTMLGVLTLRGTTVPLYAPSIPLGVSDSDQRAALIFVRARGAVALAVDDVDDVLVIAGDDVQRSPLDFTDGVLVGVARRGADLIGVLDADALIAACRAEPVLETA
jgi:purine-binding chemotaxis protein CheW